MGIFPKERAKTTDDTLLLWMEEAKSGRTW